ncbi:hypothetical protein [Paenibacillus pinihumi]|uniref:hypothetical protein n=1 Tax=Paenibacillus pinihumi TaxID=669462 RepID=UPI00040CCABF
MSSAADIDEALKIADKVILLNEGKIVQQGAPNAILGSPKNQFVREFLGVERFPLAYNI